MYLESWRNQFFDSGFLEVDCLEDEVSLLLDVMDFCEFELSFKMSYNLFICPILQTGHVHRSFQLWW